MWSMAGMTVLILGVDREKNVVACFKIYKSNPAGYLDNYRENPAFNESRKVPAITHSSSCSSYLRRLRSRLDVISSIGTR